MQPYCLFTEEPISKLEAIMVKDHFIIVENTTILICCDLLVRWESIGMNKILKEINPLN